MKDLMLGRIIMSANGFKKAIGPSDPGVRAKHEALIRDDFDRCHPGDSFDNLKNRARFSKEDQGLLRDWMAIAAGRARRSLQDPRARGIHGRADRRRCPDTYAPKGKRNAKEDLVHRNGERKGRT
ncbi:hypothetical protein [Oricola nitratireducens]|uniref:hypothetical protein n=1 Tax=Oricola nitratireducens TaxID=2775868 RepID=UPI001866FA72|nr:hypothetical protein [Oricola nitratireducens]